MSRQTPLQYLTQIRDDLPNWIEQIDNLARNAGDRLAEWTKAAEEDQTQPTPKRKKTGSVISLKPDNQAAPFSSSSSSLRAKSPSPEPARNPSEPRESLQPASPKPLADLDPGNRNLFRDLREQKKKRKLASLKDGASGPPRFRPRHDITIWYDSSIQTDFEKLVRSISTARNMLRKGKSASALQSRVSGMKVDVVAPGTALVLHQYQMRSVPRLSQPGSSYLTGLQAGLEIYDIADKELEGAQTMCEVGAHQILRDGDCLDELQSTKVKVEKCMKIITAEVQSLQQREDSVQKQSKHVAHTEEAMNHPSHKSKRSISSLDADGVVIDGPLEADDNADEESIEVDLLALPGRRHYSSRHLSMKSSATAEVRRTIRALPASHGASNSRSAGSSTDGGRAISSTELKDEDKMAIEASEAAIVIDKQHPPKGPRSSSDKLDANVDHPALDIDVDQVPTSPNQDPDVDMDLMPAPNIAIDALPAAVEDSGDEPQELNLSAMRQAIAGRAKPAVPDMPIDMTDVSAIIAKAQQAEVPSDMPAVIDPLDIQVASDLAVDSKQDDSDGIELDLSTMRTSVKRRSAAPKASSGPAVNVPNPNVQAQNRRTSETTAGPWSGETSKDEHAAASATSPSSYLLIDAEKSSDLSAQVDELLQASIPKTQSV